MAPVVFARSGDRSVERSESATRLLSPPLFSIIHEIFAYLPRRDLFSAMLVCRGMCHAAREQLYRNVKVKTARWLRRVEVGKELYKVNLRRVESWKLMLLLERLRDESIQAIIHSLTLRIRLSDLREEIALGKCNEVASSTVIYAVQNTFAQALLAMPCLQHLSIDMSDIPVDSYSNTLWLLLCAKDYAHRSTGRSGLKTLAWEGSLRKFPFLAPTISAHDVLNGNTGFMPHYVDSNSPTFGSVGFGAETIPDLRELSITAFWDENELYSAYPWLPDSSDTFQRYECVPVYPFVKFFSLARNLRKLSLLDFRWHDLGEILKAATCPCFWLPGYSSSEYFWPAMEEELDIDSSGEHTHHFHHLENLSVLKISRMVEITPNISSFLRTHPNASTGNILLEVDSLKVCQKRCVDWCNSEKYRKRWNVKQKIQILTEIMGTVPVKLCHTELEPVIEEAVSYFEREVSKSLKFQLKEAGLWDKLILEAS